MNRLAIFRVIWAAALCLVAIGLGSTLHLPALAAADYRQIVAPMVSATCASSSPCLQESNSLSGAGVKGVSTSGNGTIGQTKFKSTSSNNAKAGVFGQDLSTSGSFDSGVLGTSTNGAGVRGTSVNGNGVVALSSNQSALFAENTTFGDAIQAVSVRNDGTNSSTQNNSSIFSGRSGVWGHDDSTDGGRLNVGVAGSSTNGIGMSGSSSTFVGVNAVGGGTAGEDYPALSVIGNSGLHALITGCASSAGVNPCDSFDASFVVDGQGGIFTTAGIGADGNVDILGQYQVNGNCVAGCSAPRNAPGKAVTRYVPTASVPTVEDFGEAQLVDGQAHVRLSADFANVVDQHAGYLVFVTPEGDTDGVYVTQKTSSGFVVRENHGGRSTVALQYRIVAKPYGVNAPRLPMVQTHRTRTAPTRRHT